MDIVSYIPLGVRILYFFVVFCFVFFALCAVYIVVNYGEKLKVSLITSAIFICFFLIITALSYNSLTEVIASLTN